MIFDIPTVDIYRQQLLDHYQNPRNQGDMPDATHKAEGANPICGDQIQLFLKVKKGKILDIKFLAQSCAITMASASMITEQIKGKTVSQVKKFTLDDLLQLLGTPLTSSRQQCAQVVLGALQSALTSV